LPFVVPHAVANTNKVIIIVVLINEVILLILLFCFRLL